jgi:hypothetical protein
MTAPLALAALAAGVVFAQPGLKPLPSAADYRANAAGQKFEIGARLLSPDEVRSHFATPVGRNYLVVEVGLYPSSDVDVRLADFSLRAGGASGDLLRPIAPRVVAARIAGPSRRGRSVDVYPAVGVGYGSYGGMRGWSTEAGVGVGVGPSGPRGASDADLRTMEAELGEQALAEGFCTQPAAGYLYFAAPKQRNVTFDLEYRPASERVTVPLVVK